MSRRERDALAEIAAALAAWDPIGVRPHSTPADLAEEYRGYAPGVLGLLKRGADERRLAEHLADLCSREMGVRPDAEREAVVASSLRQIAQRTLGAC